MDAPIGERFARAVAGKDEGALVDLLKPELDFQAMTPRKIWDATSATEVVRDIIFGRWFEESDRIVAIDSIDNDVVADRERVGYRFRVTNDDGTFLVEQQAYIAVEDDRVAWLRIMCSGYRPVDATPEPA